MNKYLGKFIVIDGTDGSGKTTQLNLLREALENDGYKVEIADFPQYNTKSAGAVEEYLSGKYGKADEVGPYKASVFYAVDRYDASFKIKKWLNEGKIVLSNRYTSANMGHQGCKIDNSLERKVFFNWLYELEYKMFEIPEPDLSIILHVAPEISQKLAKERSREDWDGKTGDIHEDNIEHLQKAEQTYLEIANSFPNFFLIECTPNNTIISREEIHRKVWNKSKELLERINFIKSTKEQLGFDAIGDIINNNHKAVLNGNKNSSTLLETEIKEVLQEIIEPEISEKKIVVEKIDRNTKLPQKAHAEDAGYDLYANDYHSISPYSQNAIPTGIKMAIPSDHVGLIWDKSGLATEGITTLGGVIDSNYRGEIKVVIKNLSENVFNIVPGQKIAQILIQPLSKLSIIEDKINDITEREANGFGSSGKF